MVLSAESPRKKPTTRKVPIKLPKRMAVTITIGGSSLFLISLRRKNFVPKIPIK